MKVLFVQPSLNNVTEDCYPLLDVLKSKYNAVVDIVRVTSFDSVTLTYHDKTKKEKIYNFYIGTTASRETYDVLEKIEIKFPTLFKKILFVDRHFGRNQFINEIHYVGTEDSTASNEKLLTDDIMSYFEFAHNIVAEGNYNLLFCTSGNYRADFFSLFADYYTIPCWEVFYSRIRGDQTPHRYLTNSYLKNNFLSSKDAFNNVTITETSKKYLESTRVARSTAYLINYRPKWKNFIINLLKDIKWFFKSKDRKGYYLDRIVNKIYYLMSYYYQRKILSKTVLNSATVAKNEKSALVALCQVPEIILLSWAVNQISHVDYINKIYKNLPLNWLLNLREHPHNVGVRPYVFLKWVRSLRDTRILSLDETQYSQIASSTVCITTNGTMGWEALLLQKPVITFCDSFYDLTELNYRIRDYAELNDIERIVQNFQRLTEDEKAYDEKLLRLISLDEQTCFSTIDKNSMVKILDLALKHPYKPFWLGK
jgi:hypothetical protein